MSSDAIDGIGGGAPTVRPIRSQATQAGEFARVFDLAAARRERMTGPDRIPDAVWEDIHRASELVDDLAARGHHVRFDTHRLTGRVVASLCDSDGRVMRPVSLGEVLGEPPRYEYDHDPDPAPAA